MIIVTPLWACSRSCVGSGKRCARIPKEQARLVADAANARNGLVENVKVRWDEGMTVPEIADALRRTPGEVQRAFDAAREAGGVRIRRRRQVRERRRVRDAHAD
jgi:hypothetical protein